MYRIFLVEDDAAIAGAVANAEQEHTRPQRQQEQLNTILCKLFLNQVEAKRS